MYIPGNELSGEEDFFERCASFCANRDGCHAIAVNRHDIDEEYEDDYYNYVDQYYDEFHGISWYNCYITSRVFHSGPKCWGSACHDPNDHSDGVQFGVFKDYYEEKPDALPVTKPDGTFRPANANVKGVCDKISTAFGEVNYREMNEIAFLADSKNVVRESGSNCAARCFERAGCSAFYVTVDGCTFIMGYAYGARKNSEVSEAGKIQGICPNTAFTNTFTLVSRFECIFYSPAESQSIADDIVARNTGNANTPLREWKYQTISNSPMITSSQAGFQFDAFYTALSGTKAPI